MTIGINVNCDSSFGTVRSQSRLSSALKINVATLSASCLAFTYLEKLFRSTPLIQRLDLERCNLTLFQKLKSPFKRKKFQTVDEVQENMRSWWRFKERILNSGRDTGRTVWGTKVPTLKTEHWGVIFLCTMFLSFCTFFDKCLYFSYYMNGYFPDSSRIHPWHLIFWL